MDKQVQPRISLLVALDSTGKIWCSLTQANTDTDIMTTFENDATKTSTKKVGTSTTEGDMIYCIQLNSWEFLVKEID